jgi:hypothetical protein
VHSCLSVVCCQVEVSATSLSLVQRNRTDCGASLCVIKKPRGRGGYSQRWAAVSAKMMMIIIIVMIITISRRYEVKVATKLQVQ